MITNDSTTPRTTATNNRATEMKTGRKHFDPTRIFIQRDRLPWVWFAIAVATLVLSAWERQNLLAQLGRRERVVIIDPSHTYYLSPLMQFEEAKDLHAEQATLATLALLERSPKDFDHPELLKKVYLKPALAKAESFRDRDAVEFRSKQLHQKAELARIDILGTRENEVLINVTGQVIRNGIFQDKAFTETIPYRLRLKVLRNPNMTTNGRFPTAVADFKYETIH